MSRRVLMLSSVAYMINQFNLPNIKLLRDMGYEVDVACNLNDDSLPIETRNQFMEKLDNLGVKFYQIDFSRNPFVINKTTKAYRQVRKIMKERNYYFVHCHTPVGGLIGRLAFRKSDTKVIYTAHGFHFYKGAPLINWMIYYPIEKYLSKYTDVLITINNEDYELSINKFSSNVNKYVAGVGIDTSRFLPKSTDEKNKLKKNFNVENNFILLMVGELNDNKNQLEVINAIPKIIDKIPNVKLIIVGKGSNYELYKKEIISKNMEKHIELLGYKDNVSEFMSIANVMISSSKREGLPVNVLEAKSSGLPIIVSNCRGNIDLVDHGVNGLVYKDNLEESIIDVYNNYEVYSVESLNIKKYLSDYNIENVMQEMSKIYKEI